VVTSRREYGRNGNVSAAIAHCSLVAPQDLPPAAPASCQVIVANLIDACDILETWPDLVRQRCGTTLAEYRKLELRDQHRSRFRRQGLQIFPQPSDE
jgi:hypothetical protein